MPMPENFRINSYPLRYRYLEFSHAFSPLSQKKPKLIMSLASSFMTEVQLDAIEGEALKSSAHFCVIMQLRTGALRGKKKSQKKLYFEFCGVAVLWI